MATSEVRASRGQLDDSETRVIEAAAVLIIQGQDIFGKSLSACYHAGVPNAIIAFTFIFLIEQSKVAFANSAIYATEP